MTIYKKTHGCDACGAPTKTRFRFCFPCGEKFDRGELNFEATAPKPVQTGNSDEVTPGHRGMARHYGVNPDGKTATQIEAEVWAIRYPQQHAAW